MPARGRTTTQKKLGWPHQQRRDQLLRNLKDGTPCPCLDLDDCGPACLCRPHGQGQPMFKDAARNPDQLPLEADHTTARSQGGGLADRLLLATCNRSRGDGTRSAPANTAAFTRPPWWTRDWFDAPPPRDANRVTPSGPRLVVLLSGPPGAGKTTAARASGLAVYDRDDAHWTSDQQFTAALAQLAAQPDARAVVIRSGASSSARAKTAALIGATHIYLLTASPAELGHRIARRNRADRTRTLAAIRTWYERHDRDDDVDDFPGWHALDIEGARA